MPMSKIELFEEERLAIKPPDDINIAEWSGRYRILGKHSAIKGPYNLAMVPFLAPVMDDCCDPNVDEVGCCASAQLGKTDGLLVNTCGFYSDQEPSPIMVVLADQDTAEYVNTEKVRVMFEESEHLRHFYDSKTFNKEEITISNGARIDFAWASSVARLASKTCRITIADEIDKPGWNKVTAEAGAMSLLKERANTYPMGYRKHIWFSTPTTRTGNIIMLMQTFDIVYDWHVPCPHCGQLQPLRWSSKYLFGFKDDKYRAEDGTMHEFGGVVWEGGRDATRQQITETARYACGECGGLWTSAEKNKAVSKGRRIPRTEPTGYERRKFTHLNRLLSLFDGGRLDVMVQDWCDIFKKQGTDFREALKGFVNSTLAEPFEEVVIASTESKILKARTGLPAQIVPNQAVALTAFIDNQKYGFWFVVRAWARDFTSWNIHYGQLATWDDVERLLFETEYPVEGENNLAMKIWRAALDTGGGKKFEDMSMTEEAYWWLRNNATGRGCRVWGTKGASSAMAGLLKIGKALDKTPSGRPLPGGLSIITLNTNDLKENFHYRIGQAIKGRSRGAYLHAGEEVEHEEYVSHILAEEKKVKANGTVYWDQVKKRNDLLDCEVGCAAVADPSWPGGGVNLVVNRINTVRTGEIEPEPETTAPKKRRKMRGGFVNGWKR